jgi:hypothetical protein
VERPRLLDHVLQQPAQVFHVTGGVGREFRSVGDVDAEGAVAFEVRADGVHGLPGEREVEVCRGVAVPVRRARLERVFEQRLCALVVGHLDEDGHQQQPRHIPDRLVLRRGAHALKLGRRRRELADGGERARACEALLHCLGLGRGGVGRGRGLRVGGLSCDLCFGRGRLCLRVGGVGESDADGQNENDAGGQTDRQ